MKSYLLLSFALATLVLLTVSASGATAPSMPTNLEVVSRTDTTVTLAWGPSQPDPFFGISETKNSLTIGWGVSQDTRSSVTYTLYKDGKVIASGLTSPQYTINGLTGRKVTSFRTCVEGVNAAGQKSPQTCSTWSKQ